MDSAYLKANVMEALTDAVTSMAVKIPDDEIEYLGKYLITYVERKKAAEVSAREAEDADSRLKVYEAESEIKKMLEDEKADEIVHFERKFNQFVESILSDYKSKADAMDGVVSFIESHLNIPAAYIATKRVVGESEELNYVATGPSQKHILGKKLLKPAVEDGEDAPPRLGVSFEAFKMPEVPEEEEAAVEEGEDAPPPRLPPVAQPLIIDNVMRDKRCKFFGIPKLGSFVAVPFSYQSTEHESGVTMVGEEGGETPPELVISKKEAQFILAVDTIGAFRVIKPAEIERLKQIGDQLVILFEKVEQSLGEEHLLFMKSDTYASLTAVGGGEFATKAGEAEGAATAKIAEELAGDPAANEEGVSELLKPYKEAAALLSAWNALASSADITTGFMALQGHVLPPPLPVVNLFYAVCALVGFASTDLQNACEDPDWTAIRKNCLSSLSAKIAQYDPATPRPYGSAGVSKANSLAAVKAFAEANGLLDGGVYPGHLPICSAVLVPWLTKALAAREAAVAFFAESKTALE